MSDTPDQIPPAPAEEPKAQENNAKAAKKPAKSKKPSVDMLTFLKEFDYKSLNETQWGMLIGGIFLFGYILYEFVLMAPVAMQPQMAPMEMQTYQGETEEQRFKRENKNASLPDGSGVTKKDVEETTQLTQQIPFGDRSMEFRVRLPNNWVMSEFARYGLPGEENYQVLTNIARYFGPAIEDARPFFWVEVERMGRYMTAETWAKAYMTKRGITPEAFQVKSAKEVQALYVDVRDLRSYAMRTLFKIDGNRMVLASYGVPVQEYQHAKDMMGLSLGSFQLIRPDNREIEKINEYKLLNVIRFKHYASWSVKNEYSESTLRPSVEIHNPQEYNNPKGDLLQGIILVNIWRKSPQFPDETNMREIKDRLQELRMTIKEEVGEEKKMPLTGNFESVTQKQYIAQVNTYVQNDQFDIVKSEASKTQQEVWITTLDNGYYKAYLTLVSPVRGTNYSIWAQNMAAYDLLIESLTIRGSPTADQ